MPAEADARRKILARIAQRLVVVAETQIEREIVRRPEGILREDRREPLRQIVAVDAEIDRLRVVLNVSERQLIGWRGRRVQECERAEHGSARLAAGTAGVVPRERATEAEIVFAERPRRGVGELDLTTVHVGHARLADREWRGSCARICGREVLRLPQRDWRAVVPAESRLVEQVWIDDPGV